MKTISYTEPVFTFAEAVTATRAEQAWLRTFLQRDKSGLGTKHRTGRLMFSTKDIVAITLLHRLNAVLRIAPSAAWEILGASERVIAEMGIDHHDRSDIRVGIGANGKVYVWTREGDRIVTWNDAAEEDQLAALGLDNDVHIIIPLRSLYDPIAEVSKIAEAWPEG